MTALGHAHPHLVKALTEQANKLWHTSNLFRIPGQERLAERLIADSFADSVFFTNSGAEAVECGFKLMRKYHDDFGDPKRYRVITCEGAFHGRTLATIAAGGQEKYLKGLRPTVDGFDQVAFGNLNELRAAIAPRPPPSWSSRCRAKAACAPPWPSICKACAPLPTSSACC